MPTTEGSKEVRVPLSSRDWMLLVGAGIGTLFYSEIWGGALLRVGKPGGLAVFASLFLPTLAYLGIITAVLLHRRLIAIGIAAGMSIVPLVAVPPFVFFSTTIGATPARVLSPMTALLLPAIVLLAGVVTALFKADGRSVVMVAIVAGAICGWGYLRFAFDSWDSAARHQGEIYSNIESPVNWREFEKHAWRINICNQTYAQSHNSYAPTLKELGPEGSKCITADEVTGHSGTYQFRYEWSAQNPWSYRLDALVNGNSHDFAELESGSSGIVTLKAASISLSVVPPSHVDELWEFANCLDTYKKMHGEYPVQLVGISTKLSAAGNVRYAYCLLRFPWTVSASGEIQDPAYKLHYAPINTSGRNLDFQLDLRPLEYGVTGLRSYMEDGTANIYGTPADRNATKSDPKVPACEAHGTSCVQQNVY